MANLVETSRWESGIYLFETSDPVMGGPNGIDNRPTRELANRTLWLKNELAKAVESIGNNQKSTDDALLLKVDKTTTIAAGNGLAGGGNLTQSRTITLGTPSKITSSTTNTVSAASHTHEIDKASTEVAGVVQLNNTLTSPSINQAATAATVKKLQDEKMPLTTFDFQAAPINYGKSGFFRANGRSLNDNPLPSMEIHIAHPNYDGGQYARGIGFGYGGSFALTTTSWDPAGNYLGMRHILTEENGVMLSGNQTVNGTKTFSSIQEFSNGLRFSTPAKNIWGVLAMDSNGVYLSNPASNKFIKLTDGGELQYGGEKVFTYFDRSDSYTLDDTSKLATSRALKLLNDVSASVNTSITAGNGLTGGGTLAASRTLALGTPGTITASSTNAVQAAGHTHAIDTASLTVAGVVQLSSATDSTAVNMAATPAAVRAAMQAASQATPTGTIAYFAGDSAPAGWLKANGAQVSRSVYADLFAAISTRFGAGNGSTTFTLPDLRGVFLRGFDDWRGFDGGRVLGSLQNHNLAEHRHATGWRINNNGNEFALVRNNWSGELAVTANVSSENVAVIPGDAESYNQAAGFSHAATNDRYATSRAYYDAQGETRPTNVALLACIKI